LIIFYNRRPDSFINGLQVSMLAITANIPGFRLGSLLKRAMPGLEPPLGGFQGFGRETIPEALSASKCLA
jgi:hypothetical protein